MITYLGHPYDKSIITILISDLQLLMLTFIFLKFSKTFQFVYFDILGDEACNQEEEKKKSGNGNGASDCKVCKSLVAMIFFGR